MSSGGEELNGKEPFGLFTVSGPKVIGTIPTGTATITTREYGFDTSGLKAGINHVVASNKGKEWHHVIMGRINPGKTLDEVKKELLSNLQGPPQTVDQSTFQFISLMNPGVSFATDITLTAGNYVFVCFMPDAKGKPHVMNGMVQEVKVA